MRLRRVVGLVGATALIGTGAFVPGPVAAQTASNDAAAAGTSGGPAGATVSIVVTGDAPLDQAQVDLATGGVGRIRRTVPALGATVVDVPASSSARALHRLDAVHGVDSATPDHTVKAFDITPNDPAWSYQDSLRSVHAPAAWSTSTGSSSVVIAMVDSGVNEAADLAGRVLPGHDFVNNDNDPTDDAGHGTDAALVAAAAGNDAAGAAGMCWSCKILPVKVLDSDGTGAMSDVAAGIVWAVDHGADVINLSLGGTYDDPVVADALAYAHRADIVVVASAGNDGTAERNYPAAVPGVLSVTGSTTDTRTLYSWAQRGPTWVDVAAPGCNYVVDDEGLYRFCGTSSAAPLVAGLAGLLRSVRPSASREMVMSAIDTSADFPPTTGLVGYGIIDAARAVAAIPTIAPGPVPLPPDVTPPTVSLEVGDGYYQGVGTVHVTSADDQSVAVAEVFVDGQQVATIAAPASSQAITFDTTGFGDGTHEVVADVNDAAGHRVASAPATIRIDNVNPVGILTSPSWGAKVSGSFVARVYVTDPSGIMGTFLVANDQVVGGFIGAGWGQATVPVTRTGLVRVVAITVDNAGHISGTNSAVIAGSVPKRRSRR